MTVTISRLYDDPYAAHRAVNDLEAAGIPSRDISIVASNADEWFDGSSKTSRRKVDRDADGTDDRAEGAGVGAGIGAALGGAAGVLAGLGLMAIPGLGPVVAAGWLAAAATGAVAGGATGGIIGALTQADVSKTDAEVYAEGVRRGGTLVTARVADGERARAEAILDQAAINIREREQTWRDAGWTGFDPNARPYSADQIRTEREIYRERTVR
jgi:hypothetical protein